MKKLILPFLALLFLISCEKESTNELITEDQIYENQISGDVSATTRSSNKRNVCHNGKIKNVSINAIPAHQGHGDAVDMDEDGYFDIDNPCSETDCDDTNAAINPGAIEIICNGIDDDCNTATPDSSEEICNNGIDDDCDGDIDEADSDCAPPCAAYEINSQGPLFVALADEAGTYTWQGAKNACAAKAAADGCGWFLPNKNELNAMYAERNNIGGFNQSVNSYYWSTTSASSNFANTIHFNDGFIALQSKSGNLRCRCVRR